MMVEANDAVRCGHDEMQIVRDHQDAAIEAVAQTADQLVELDLARDVDPLRRLVQHQEVGRAQQRAG